jgi:hypothetical protein
MKHLYKIELKLLHTINGCAVDISPDYYKPLDQWTLNSPLVDNLVKKRILSIIPVGNAWYNISRSDLELYIYYKSLYCREKLPAIQIVTPNNNPYQRRKFL